MPMLSAMGRFVGVVGMIALSLSAAVGALVAAHLGGRRGGRMSSPLP